MIHRVESSVLKKSSDYWRAIGYEGVVVLLEQLASGSDDILYFRTVFGLQFHRWRELGQIVPRLSRMPSHEFCP